MKTKYLVAIAVFALVAVASELISRRVLFKTPAPSSDRTVASAAPRANDRIQGIMLAKQAMAQQSARQYAQAARTLDSAAVLIPQLSGWLNAFAASSLSFAGDTAAVARRLARLDSMMVHEWAWRMRARSFASAGKLARALDIATVAAFSGPASKRAAAWYVIAEYQRDRGNPSAQRAALLRAIEVAPTSDAAADAARLLVKFADLTNDERLRAGRALMRNGEVRKGVAELRAFITETDEAGLRDDVRYEIGRALFSIGEYQGAETELRKIGRGHARAADARFLIGRAQYRQRKAAQGSATFRSVVTDYPTSLAATRALFFLGDLAHDDGRLADAIKYFGQAAARHQLGGQEPAEALMRIGAIHFAQKRYAEADRIFELYRSRFRSGAAFEQATFWSAQTQMKLGNSERARERLHDLDGSRSLSYYDVRAAEQLEQPLIKDLPPGPPVDSAAVKLVDPALDRWQLLRDIGWNEAATFELNSLKKEVGGNPPALYAIGEGLNERGHSYAAIALGRELLQNGAAWNARLLRMMYPLPYRDIIERESRARGLDPAFVTALMRQESRFNPRAVSGAGAIGLMQVMPATGRQLGGRGLDLTDPATNIRLGTKFLADLQSMYGARTDAVLAAYNAGPSRMARWKSFPEFAMPDLFAERIPFDETRDYVKVIRVNTAIYHELYAARSAR